MALASQVQTARAPMWLPRMGDRPDIQFIQTLASSLIERYRPRNQDYETLVNAWHGIYYQNADTRYDMDSLGRPQLRVQDVRGQDVPNTYNILKAFADAPKRMLVGLPDPRVPRPAGKFANDLAGQKMAEDYQAKMKRACYGIWDASQMEIQQVDAAFYLTICGSVGMVVVPDFDRGHAVIRYVAPYDIYGIQSAQDDHALSRVIIAVDEDYYKVQSKYGFLADVGGQSFSTKDELTAASTASEPLRNNKTVRHTIYMDESWYIELIGNTVVGEAHHGLGFCPALICPYVLLPGYVNRGHSAIEQLLPMQLSINFSNTLLEEGLKDAMFPTTWVREPQSVPQNWSRGMGQLITIGANGEIGELGGRSQEAMRTVVQYNDLMQRLMELTSGVSRPALSGNLPGGGPTSGRGIEKASGPYLSGIEEIQTTQGYFMAKALKMALDMTAATGPENEIWERSGDDKVCFSGAFKGQDFYEEFTRDELKSVPTPDMSYSPLAHLGMHERLTMVLQGLGAKPPLISWNAAVDMLGWEKDHPNLRSEIESDLAWRLEIMQREIAVQQGKQPGGDQQPGPDALRTAAAAAAGASSPEAMRQANVGGAGNIPAGGAPTGNGGPVPMMAGAPVGGAATAPAGTSTDLLSRLAGGPPPAPQGGGAGIAVTRGSVVDQVRDELVGMPLKGEVLMSGSTVWVDWKDKAAVAKALKHREGLTVRVKGKQLPKDASLVASPSEGKKGPR